MKGTVGDLVRLYNSLPPNFSCPGTPAKPPPPEFLSYIKHFVVLSANQCLLHLLLTKVLTNSNMSDYQTIKILVIMVVSKTPTRKGVYEKINIPSVYETIAVTFEIILQLLNPLRLKIS